ncbi:hypothetical protein [Rhodococcus sp. WY5]|uniref:hypothetical protein n=1 Tax=Rhodococcus sp. WY5 TaxID=2708349 RepID=UPI0011C18F7B|nr:hypothetical protein [Rhodococcus sp. WY5]
MVLLRPLARCQRRFELRNTLLELLATQSPWLRGRNRNRGLPLSRFRDQSNWLVRHDPSRILPAVGAWHGNGAMHRRFLHLAVASDFDDMAAVEPYSPAHDLIVGRPTRVHRFPCAPDSLNPLFSQAGVLRFFGAPPCGEHLDMVMDLLGCRLLAVIAAGKFVGFEWDTVTAVKGHNKILA